jgi:methenyltetrahydromethanopterin cyclohydrolase
MPATPRPATLSPTVGTVQAADATWLVAVDVLAALGSVGSAVFLALELFSKTQA